ncbi:MAG TPA: hypothetical protein VL354_09570 [Spirochaetia bacterium]|nr:hypothetical protein [Spirochaetia bacterium]
MVALSEDQIVDAVIAYLQRAGWTIKSRSHANEHGDDIVAERNGRRLSIEAKGAGSSKPGTNRYGLVFSKGQVFDHVAKAVLKTMRAVAQEGTIGGIALPDNEHHRSEVEKIVTVLSRLQIAVFWVLPDGQVVVKPGQPDID